MKPNFLFLHFDSIRASALSCYGNPIAATPNFERLAKGGVLFENCVAPFPLCAPSRCSMLTGLYPHAAGHRTLWQLLRSHEPSLMRYLKNDGYAVRMYGKNDAYSKEYLDEVCDNIGELRGKYRVKGATCPRFGKNPHEPGSPMFYSFLWDEIEDETDEPLLPDAEQAALEWLEEAPDDKPFMLYVPTELPHPPYSTLSRFYHMYDGADVSGMITPLAEVYNDGSQISEHRAHFNADKFDKGYYEKILRVYLGMVSYCDYLLGRFLDVLESRGLAENTVVIVSSDHGDYAGDKGLFEKRLMCLEDDMIHVPLIISAPGVLRDRRAKGQTELFDIMPTVLDFAGIKCGHHHNAVSLLPHMTEGFDDLSRRAFAEAGYSPRDLEFANQRLESDGVKNVGNPYYLYTNMPEGLIGYRSCCVREAGHKLIWRANGRHELFDLINDPGETKNLVDEPAHINTRERLKEALLKWYLDTADMMPPWTDRRDWK